MPGNLNLNQPLWRLVRENMLCRRAQSMAVIEAARSGDIPLLRALLDYKWRGDINAPWGESECALIEAVCAGQLHAVEVLLEHGAYVNVICWRGRTALAWAVIAGRTDMVERLLAAGADPNVRDKQGTSPLWWAGGFEPIVMALKQAGAQE